MGNAKTKLGQEALTTRESIPRSGSMPATRSARSKSLAEMRFAGNLAVQHLFETGAIRAKLSVGSPGDTFELEADRMAEAALSSSPTGKVQQKCSACAKGASCSDCEATGKIQAKARAGQTPHIAPAAETRIEALHGGGQPLSSTVRRFFEPRFGRDFSDVRVHTDDHASESAAAIRAKAYTAGRDIAFSAGEYEPESAEGRRLISHELAHVAQGGRAVRRQPNDEDQEEKSVHGPNWPSLLSMDYSGPEVCGGQPCITDEQIYAVTTYSAEIEALEAEATKDTTPVGVVGPFVVAVATTRAPAPAAPAKTSPPGTPKVVQGSGDETVIDSTYSMANRTGYQPTGMGKDTLSGVEEMTLVAHANQQVVALGVQHLSPSDLAQSLVDAGWRGGTLRLAACQTGICAAGNSYAQSLANELFTRGAETVVIAPKGNTNIVAGSHGLPQVRSLATGGGKPQLLAPGKGWDYFTAEEPTGWQYNKGWLSPKGWRGPVTSGAKMGAMIALSIIHGKAVAERTRQETEATGFSAPGPTGDLGYDLGAWFLDPTDEASRSIPFSERFEMTKMRETMRQAANRMQPGEYYECSWTTSDGEDTFGTPMYRRFYAKYRKGANGYWYTISCEDCEGDDFPPDLNKIINPDLSDDEIREYLKLPSPFSNLA